MGRPARELYSGGIASIDVGPDQTPFDVHLELLCECSPYFDEVFEDRLSLPPRDPFSLPDVDPDTFADFLSWAYQGTLKTLFKESPTWIRLCRLWVLGGTFEVPQLQNMVIRWCILKHRDGKALDESAVRFIYKNTTLTDPLRNFAVDSWMHRLKKSQFDSMKSNLPRELIEDLCAKLLGLADQPTEQENLQLAEASMSAMNYYVDVPLIKLRVLRSAPSMPHEEPLDIPARASELQLKNRKFKQPRSRRRSGTATPADSTPSLASSTTAERSEEENNIVSKLEAMEV